MKPLIKWAGGKTHMLGALRKAMPKQFGRYFEPFFGGGALFFSGAAEGHFAYLSDANRALMRFYGAIESTPFAVIDACKTFKVDKEHYYAVRDKWDHVRATPAEDAARFLYLNKACFNGLYRVNGDGRFNVPWGKKRPDLAWFDGETIIGARDMLRDAKLVCLAFEQLGHLPQRDDFVYLDPPYATDSEQFTAYTKNGFGVKEHENLIAMIASLTLRGVKVLVSNAWIPWTARFYPALGGTKWWTKFSAPRSIGAHTRARAEELLWANYEVDDSVIEELAS